MQVAEDGDGDAVDEAVQTETGADAAAPTQAEADGGHGILSLAWTFVISFFSSLAPQQPPPVNAN